MLEDAFDRVDFPVSPSSLSLSAAAINLQECSCWDVSACGLVQDILLVSQGSLTQLLMSICMHGLSMRASGYVLDILRKSGVLACFSL